MKPCIFLDRDGVVNQERGTYTYKVKDFKIIEGVLEAVIMLKKAGYQLIIITNQGGIAKGVYEASDVWRCYDHLQKITHNSFDAMYLSPYHPDYTESLSRKPDSLMLEKAIAKYQIMTAASWMIGDQERDIIAGKKVGVQTILISGEKEPFTLADFVAKDLQSAQKVILRK